MSAKHISFDERFPNIAAWSLGDGWIEIGRDDYSRSQARVMDAGGMLWEGKEHYDSMEELLQDMETALTELMDA